MRFSDSLTALIVAVAMASPGDFTMAGEVNLWMLDEEPIGDGSANVELELFGVQPTMGSGGTRETPESRVTIAKPLLFAPPRGATVSQTYAYYLAKLPFTVHEPSDGRDYRRLELRVSLSDPATGFKLLPDAVLKEEDVKRVYDLSLALGRAGVNLGGDLSYVVAFKRAVPVIRSYGEGEASFYWVYERHQSAPSFLEGSQHTLVIIRVPRETTTISGKIDVAAVIKSRFPWEPNIAISSEPVPVEWQLEDAEGFDAIPFSRQLIDDTLL